VENDCKALTLDDGTVIECVRTLRNLPGRRLVFEGRFKGRRVVVKVFMNRQRAQVHSQREVDGLAALNSAGIAAPEVLFAGSDRQANPVVVLAWIENAVALSARWHDADPEQRVQLARRMMALLASHHRAGIFQADLHLDNFLVGEDLIYTLDGDAVVARAHPLDESRSQQNLALYCSQLGADLDPLSLQQSAYYARLRDWDEAGLARRLPGLIDAARSYRWRKLRSKIFRDCSAVAHSKTATQVSFTVRAYGPGLPDFLAGLDASCPADPVRRLKNGNTATVWRVDFGGRQLVVKRYNVKNRLHGIMRTLKESRASISWRNAHMLGMFGITTPAPVALLIRRAGWFRPVAYFVAEDVSGPSLLEWVGENQDDLARVRQAAVQVGRLFSQLQLLRISHGDMKASNFILGPEGLVVVDLDAMQQHRWRSGFERAWRRDMARFAANWLDRPKVQEIMHAEIRSAAVN